MFSDPTFAELDTRIWKPKFDLYISLEAPKSMLRDARAEALWVETPRELAGQHWRRDPDGELFIRTALATQAPWLVSGDDDLLSVPAMGGLRTVTPAQALLEWRAT